MAALLSRYTGIVDDPEAFLACATQPLPRVLWANPLRGDPAAISQRILARCPTAELVRWRPHTWRLPSHEKPGLWPEFLTGQVHAQEEVAIFAGDLMGAQPGERIVDLCAAPGGKTVLLAVQMADRGTLVANDRNQGRLAGLRRTLERLGVSCAVVTHGDAARFPADRPPQAGGERGVGFDRVLADVPCSCEGTTRKTEGRKSITDPKFRATIVQVQKSILRRALGLVRPGGQVIYATCTYAPEENEAVLDAIDPSVAVIEPLEIPAGLKVTPGILAWEGRHFRPDVIHAARLWPHHNDTGGFFCARLRRL